MISTVSFELGPGQMAEASAELARTGFALALRREAVVAARQWAGSDRV
jgi:hypothetical protein